MSKIKLPHASGNSVSIAAPQSNPAADRTLYLPSNADGTIITTASPGTILQVANAKSTTEKTTTAGSFVTWTELGISFTPKSSTSFLHCYLNMVRIICVNSAAEVRVRVTDGTNQSVAYRMTNYDSANAGQSPCYNWYWDQTHTAGSAVTISPQYYASGNGATFGDSGSNGYFTIYEIAQ